MVGIDRQSLDPEPGIGTTDPCKKVVRAQEGRFGPRQTDDMRAETVHHAVFETQHGTRCGHDGHNSPKSQAEPSMYR